MLAVQTLAKMEDNVGHLESLSSANAPQNIKGNIARHRKVSQIKYLSPGHNKIYFDFQEKYYRMLGFQAMILLIHASQTHAKMVENVGHLASL